jgi:hypothetical protein
LHPKPAAHIVHVVADPTAYVPAAHGIGGFASPFVDGQRYPGGHAVHDVAPAFE